MVTEAVEKLLEQLLTGALLVRDGKVLYANPSLGVLLDRPVEQLKGRDPLELFHPQDKSSIRQMLRRRAEGVRPRGPHLYRMLGPSGKSLQVEVEATSIGDESTGTLLLLIRDVSQRQEMEERLRQVHKMEAIGNLAAGIAHDFNNLLGAMANYLTLLRAHLAHGSEALEKMAEIQALVDRGTDLVRQILSASRMGRTEPKVQDLHKIILPVVRMLRHSLPKDISISLEEGDVPPFRVDQGQIQQVIMNLCINGADAMPQGGEIKIRTGRKQIPKWLAEGIPGVEPGMYARITVCDNGVGMSPEVRERIFEPFFTTKAGKDRTGLGLSICYAIVRAHGGFMDVESTPGQGSTFNVYLPLVEGTPEAETQPQRVEFGRETVLVVDDEEPMRLSTEQLLSSIGYRTLTASSGREALELLARDPTSVDLAVLDLGMPGMDGLQTFQEMRQIRPDLPAILLTGLPQSQQVRSAMIQGIRGVLAKPFRLEELSSCIRRALEIP